MKIHGNSLYPIGCIVNQPQGDIYMTTRSLLGDKERKYLKERNFYPPRDRGFGEAPELGAPADSLDNAAQTKHRIRNDLAFRLDEIVREVHQELEAVDLLMTTEGGHKLYEYETQMLPFAKGDLVQLRHFVDLLIERAESDYWRHREEDMRHSLDALHHDLDSVKRYREGDSALRERIESEDGRIIEPPELADEMDELAARRGALIRVLSINGVHEVLSYLHEHGPQTSIPRGRKAGNIYWRQAAKQFLVNELELAEDVGAFDSVYRLTDRGRAVSISWERLDDAETVVEHAKQHDISRREAAHELITTMQYNASEWPDAVE